MPKKQTKKDQLLEAGLDVFCEKGFDKATIDDIVDLAACGKGTFYRYFDNKESLFDELENGFRELLVTELRQNCDEQMPVREYLMASFKTFVKVFKVHQRLGLIKFARDQQLTEQERKQSARKALPGLLFLQTYLEKAIKEKTLRNVRVESIIAVVIGSAHFYLFRDFKLGIPFTESELEDTVDIFLNGVLP